VSRLTRASARALDAGDELAPVRDEFVLPDGVVYLDGHSLGPLPRAAVERLRAVIESEWGDGLVRSWNTHGWISLPERVAARIAPLIGAAADEVAVADSTSVNLFKLLAGAARLRRGRPVILSETGNFPSDLYAASGAADTVAGLEVRLVPREQVVGALEETVAVLALTHVDFRTGEMHDLEALTAAAHDAGALVLWDLAHSAGAVPLDLDGAGVDLAVGCGYKYLNGGPGAPAFAFVARCLHEAFETPLRGWMGHAAPFDFDPAYRPAPGAGRLRCGTPPILSLAALECGVDVVARAGIDALRRKTMALGDLLVRLVGQECAEHGFVLSSPADARRRGSLVSFRHPAGYAVVQALAARGVLADFRAPDTIRFGLGAAYLRFADVWDAVRALSEVMSRREWDRPDRHARATVT